MLIVLSVHSGINFLNISWHPEHCYFATGMLPSVHFCFASPLTFGPTFDQNLVFGGVSLWETFCSSLFQDDAQSHDCGTTFGIQLGPKLRPETTKWRQQSSNFNFMVVPRCAPLFYETIVNTVPLGHGGFLKIICVDGDWLIFCFCLCVLLCYVLYNMFITLFHKTLVNAQALNPLFLFWGNAAH